MTAADTAPLWLEEPNPAQQAVPPGTDGVPVTVIVVEHQGTGEDPTVIVGTDVPTVRRQLVLALAQCVMGDEVSAEFLAEHPRPTAESTDADVDAWLGAYRDATTVPWFTEYTRHVAVPQ